MNAITCRTLQADDADTVYAIAAEAWRFTYDGIFTPAFIDQFVQTNYAPEQLRRAAARAASGDTHFEVALDEDQLIGLCQLGITAQGAKLFRIYLRPHYIGQGVGRMLLQRAEAFVRNQGLSSYGCFVHHKNERGKQFYLRNGFHHQSERDDDDEWYMEKHFV
jgi:ribosomal protein S18 acetylase RimI-like enzyme